MMPLAPTPVMAMPTSKPKIGFSIDSIVGNRNNKSEVDSDNSENPASPISECGQTDQISSYNLSVDIKRALRLQPSSPEDIYNKLARYHSSSSPSREPLRHSLMSTDLLKNKDDNQTKADVNNKSPSPRINVSREGTPMCLLPSASPPSSIMTKAPIVVPGIPAGYVRPFAQAAEFKTIPPYHPSDLVQPHNTHLLAAQFTAAALANQNFSPASQHPSHLHNPNIPRESYPLYPWLLSRHGRIFPHRFPGNFLLQPFRKPKRIRTAFSPSQLLKLEHAFESNHYVVGAERKTLAQQLSLSETQVKVWFQNRRTKHKRMQQEEDSKTGNSNKAQSPENNMSGDEDELIDMEMDDYPSEDENDNV